MPGNERFLVPEMFSFLLGGVPHTWVYLDAEKFAGAKRGGSPNLAKLACAGRLMHQVKNVAPTLKKLKLPDPNVEFAEWMNYELANGWMWNEQGPSPIYWWMHFVPQVAFAVHGSGEAKELSKDWIRQFFDILELCYTDDGIVQVGMRGAGHPDEDRSLAWLFEYLLTGLKKNKFWAKHLEDDPTTLVVLDNSDLLRALFAETAHHKWPVRVVQHVYQYEHATVCVLSTSGNGNTQERAMEARIKHRPRAIFPVDGGFRKQGYRDVMACRLDEGAGVVFYRSELFTKGATQSYPLEGAGKLMFHWVWDSRGLMLAPEDEVDMAPTPEPPVIPPSPPPSKRKKWWQICG